MKDVKILKVMVVLFVMVCFVSILGCGTKTTLPTDAPLPDAGFRANISFENPPTVVKAGSDFFVTVNLKNVSSEAWPSLGGKDPIHLGYHLRDKTGTNNVVEVGDGLRTDLPYDLKPNKEVTIKAHVKAPRQPGEYVLFFDMVQESVTWFALKGSTPGILKLTVQ